MAEQSPENVVHLEQIAVTLRRRLRVLELQATRYGAAILPHVLLEREDTERELAHTLRELRRLKPTAPSEHSPYLGLLTFDEQHSSFFFGRDDVIAQLLDQAQHSSFLAVLGPSGSGKSSVVRAGLVPALKNGALPESERWHYAVMKPGARPLDALAVELARLLHHDVVALRTALAQSPRALLLHIDQLCANQSSVRLVLVVDQAEELWTLAPGEQTRENQQALFLDALLTAVQAPGSHALVVLTMRMDFLHRAAEHHELAQLISANDVIISPMTHEQLHDAIVRPAELSGGAFDPGLAEELTTQTPGRPGALPLLEYTLLELWKSKTPDGTMTWQAFHDLGGVEGGLARRADDILKRYDASQQAALRAVLLRLVQPGEGVADTRRRVWLDDLVPAGSSTVALQTLLKPLADERLLTHHAAPSAHCCPCGACHRPNSAARRNRQRLDACRFYAATIFYRWEHPTNLDTRTAPAHRAGPASHRTA